MEYRDYGKLDTNSFGKVDCPIPDTVRSTTAAITEPAESAVAIEDRGHISRAKSLKNNNHNNLLQACE